LIPDHVLNHPRFHDPGGFRSSEWKKRDQVTKLRRDARAELAEFLIQERATVKLKQAEIIPRVGKRTPRFVDIAASIISKGKRKLVFTNRAPDAKRARAPFVARVIVKLATPPVPFLPEFFPRRSSPLSSAQRAPAALLRPSTLNRIKVAEEERPGG